MYTGPGVWDRLAAWGLRCYPGLPWLEQGRDIAVSIEMLDGIARALLLGERRARAILAALRADTAGYQARCARDLPRIGTGQALNCAELR